ncbi:MAG: YibE/F family protein [Arcanobacterium sp.]|nr:YibE/F family protein [Arcanobacterium sp.]
MHMHVAETSRGEVDPRRRRTVAVVLAAIVIPMIIATVIGLVALSPRGETPVGSVPTFAQGSERVVGVVTVIGTTDEYGQTPVSMSVDGVDVPLAVPYEIVASSLDVGDRVEALFSPDSVSTDGATPAYVFVDFDRSRALVIIAVLYVLSVLLVARVKGVLAMLGLGLSLAVLMAFMIPALMVGKPELLVVLTGAAAMMIVSIYIAHGVSIRTTTALVGTAMGLVVTACLAAWAIDAANISGATDESGQFALSMIPGISLPSLMLCGMILAGLGALNDVTITQVSTVWELYESDPSAPRLTLVARAMRVGRDHIASTVYTLAFAYVGSALPLLLVSALMDTGITGVVQSADVAEEIARTLIASIGLILAIPLTTIIAASLAPIAPTSRAKEERSVASSTAKR